ncbi:BTB/POZ domain-containing protein 2-like protein [Aphelenchoides avenae]|nr:BTB/POZ domain-containing protein 2-like protein [Aphelenchus avenae]
MSTYLDTPLKDRIKTFLLNEDMADVHFLVGFDDVKERLPAHKFILSTVSEVFHRQLNGHFEVPETIDVDDTTPEIFKIVLRYVYTDELDLTPDNAFHVPYLAKKYLLNNLIGTVLQFVASAYTGPTVAKALPHLHLMEGEHEEKIWPEIEKHARSVLSSPEFLGLSQTVLCSLLRRNLDVDELTVYNSVLDWARAECTRKGLSFDRDAREVLGNALELIRFPLLSIEEFSRGPASSNVLSDEEKVEVYKSYGLDASYNPTTFSSTPRRPLMTCNRWPITQNRTWFFNFSASARVRFHGVAFFGHKDESNVYEVVVTLLNGNSGETLATTHVDVTTDGSEDTYKVLLDRPVLIAPGIQYKVTAVNIGPDTMYSRYGLREVTCEHGTSSVKFELTDTGLREDSQYDVSLEGHIPVIFFSFP